MELVISSLIKYDMFRSTRPSLDTTHDGLLDRNMSCVIKDNI
jgi:hypothetical protein